VYALDRATAGPEIRFLLSDGSSVSMRVVGGLSNLTATPTGATLAIGPVTLTLSEVAGGRTHLRYDLLSSVKPANNKVAWTVAVTGGASTALLGDGSLSLRNATGVEEATQVPPTATDRNGTAVAVTPTLANGTLTYTIANIANNRYPLTIDPTTVSTSTNASATARSQRRVVHVASTGVAIALYYDGSNWQWRSASSPYSSWSSASAVTNATREAGLTACMASNDDVHVMYRKASGPDLGYRRLTYSAGSWSLGSETVIATGDYGGGGEYFSSAVDVDGRIWLYTFKWVGSNGAEIFYSATGTSWTSSLTPASQLNMPASAVIARAGDYIVAMRMDGGSINWRRVNTNGSVGSWSSESAKTSVGLYNDHQYVALADGNGRLVLAAVPNGTDFAIRTISYIPGTDAWDTTYTDIGTGTSDRNPALAKVGNDLYCVWSEYAAANSYAIVYKAWSASGASWGSRVQMVASGANRLYVHAGGNSTTLAALWTAGTGSPYDVVFEYASFGGGAAASSPIIPPAYRHQALLGR
jgi:hypothetical protein